MSASVWFWNLKDNIKEKKKQSHLALVMAFARTFTPFESWQRFSVRQLESYGRRFSRTGHLFCLLSLVNFLLIPINCRPSVSAARPQQVNPSSFPFRLHYYPGPFKVPQKYSMFSDWFTIWPNRWEKWKLFRCSLLVAKKHDVHEEKSLGIETLLLVKWND